MMAKGPKIGSKTMILSQAPATVGERLRLELEAQELIQAQARKKIEGLRTAIEKLNEAEVFGEEVLAHDK